MKSKNTELCVEFFVTKLLYFNSFQSPLLLLFLDCVWQLCQQFPADFEFTETYLTTLWDTAHIPIFDTFLFNCERDRLIAAKVTIVLKNKKSPATGKIRNKPGSFINNFLRYLGEKIFISHYSRKIGLMLKLKKSDF